MSDDLESRLTAAMRPVPPSAQLSASLARIPLTAVRRHAPRALGWWVGAGLAASLCIAVGVQQHVQHDQERQRGLEARRQVIEALRVTSQKLDLAFETAKQRGV